MGSDEVARLPARPASVAEWEDLLVRLEIAPRALRHTLEEARADEAEVTRLLHDAARVEAEVGRWLEEAAGLPGTPPPPPESGDPLALAHRIASLRARTFAMVQRRGLEVWEWEAEVTDGGRATVHQVLCWLVGRDAQMLAALRGAVPPRSGAPSC